MLFKSEFLSHKDNKMIIIIIIHDYSTRSIKFYLIFAQKVAILQQNVAKLRMLLN